MSEGATLEREVTFQEVLPCNEDELARNIAYARSLGLRDFDDGRLGTLNIVASGPSALQADFGQIGPHIAHAAQPVLAVNGALKLLMERGVAPHWWACCDPQALVADFIPDDPPMSTSYLVSAKCHRDVFRKLKGRDVRLWHIGAAPEGSRFVKTACSVTLTAMSLMRHIGWRKFRVWGWDCCFDATGAHHASAQGAPGEDCRINLIIGDRSWPTTHSWALEAQDAAHQVAMGDYEIEIMGDSMVGAVIEEVRRQIAGGATTLTLEGETAQTAP